MPRGRIKGSRKINGIMYTPDQLKDLFGEEVETYQNAKTIKCEPFEGGLRPSLKADVQEEEKGKEEEPRKIIPGFKLYTEQDISKIEQQTGLKLSGWAAIDTTLVPVFLNPAHKEDRFYELLVKARA